MTTSTVLVASTDALPSREKASGKPHLKGWKGKGKGKGKGPTAGKSARGLGSDAKTKRPQSARPLSRNIKTESNEDVTTIQLPEDTSVAFWIQKVRMLQDEVRRANGALKASENELVSEKAKATAAEVSWSKKLQDVQRESYENALRQNKLLEQRLITEYDAKIDVAYAEMKKSYDETVQQNSNTIYKQISGCESLQHELASAKAKIGALEKQNKLLLKELNLRTSEHAKHFREEVFAESQEAVDFHKKVALEAVTKAREQRRVLQLEATRTGGKMEERAALFEQEINNASAKIVEQYRSMAKKAMDATCEERAKSKKLILDMELNTVTQRAEFENELHQQVTDRVSVYKDDIKRLEQELASLRDHYDKLVQEMLSQIQQAASNFEGETKNKALIIVESYKRRTEDTYRLLEQERAQALRRQLRWISGDNRCDIPDDPGKAKRQTRASINRTTTTQRGRHAKLSSNPPEVFRRG